MVISLPISKINSRKSTTYSELHLVPGDPGIHLVHLGDSIVDPLQDALNPIVRLKERMDISLNEQRTLSAQMSDLNKQVETLSLLLTASKAFNSSNNLASIASAPAR
jgi:hypothetical protein